MVRQILYKGSPGYWEITEGNLPPGSELNSATGEISCIPEESGNFPITVKFTNRCGEVTKELNIIVRKGGGSFKRTAFNKSFKK